MEVIKRKGNQAGYDFYLKQDNKILKIVFGGNLDLYWNLILSNEKNKYDELEETFYITKENYYLYSLFEKLINDIKEANIFEPKTPKDEYDVFGISTKEECLRWNERLKTRYCYKELYNIDTDTITWHSDDEQYEYADRVKINKKDDVIVLVFTRPKQNKNTFGFRLSDSISIRFKIQEVDMMNSTFHLCLCIINYKITILIIIKYILKN